MKKLPAYKQTEAKDCGPTCIRMVAKYYGRSIATQQLRELSETTREGSSMLGLAAAAENVGMHAIAVSLGLEELESAPLPCILHWRGNHYVVLYQLKRKEAVLADPAHGLIRLSKEEFLKNWTGSSGQEAEGIALLIESTPRFYESEFDEPEAFGFSFIFKYLLKYKRFIWQLVIGLLAGSLLQLVLPFLTQSVVDVGIKNQDLNFVYLVLFAQLLLFIGRASLEIIRGWILLHLSTRINISLISDFFIKLMKLPIAYFDVRMTGDLLQRINDHQRIERILTTSSLNVIFSTFNLLVFSLVLCYYSLQVFTVFILGSLLYFAWVLFFFKKRKELDYKRFAQMSGEQSKVIELVNGMQEIKLHNAERPMRWDWEFFQARLFKISIKSLALEQTQSNGSSLINELKNILITILSATLVIEGQITLGMMMAISYIVGQLNSPITQLIQFMRDLQDARISLDRLGEIHQMEDEEPANVTKVNRLPEAPSIQLKDVSYRYKGGLQPVLDQVSLNIPAGKTTAIVGASGSGKTTLMKMLLGFYKPLSGEIRVDQLSLAQISVEQWRERCGVVMQEGYIFNDSIARNIAVGAESIDLERLEHSMQVANITDYVSALPQGYHTKIGMEGVGLSTGQKQRILIARAVYKNPQFLFFDEATSALDAKNERVIMENLDDFLKDRTAVVIAHRLSTVKKAHQIVVLDEGKIVEQGNHKTLVALKGKYYHLVKDQLELGQ